MLLVFLKRLGMPHRYNAYTVNNMDTKPKTQSLYI